MRERKYWFVTRPKRRLDSVPQLLSTFDCVVQGGQWIGQRDIQRGYEDILEARGLKRRGERRDGSGSGGRTYGAWLKSLGLIFTRPNKQIALTLAGEALLNGTSTASEVLAQQVLKFQYPSAHSIGRSVKVSSDFRVHPFRLMLRLMNDPRIGYLDKEEIGLICAIKGTSDSDSCFVSLVDAILEYRGSDGRIDVDFKGEYGTSPENLLDVANTMQNWLEYTQLARREEGSSRLAIVDDERNRVRSILGTPATFIGHPEDEERFQRKYGLDPGHQKDTRDLSNAKTATARSMEELVMRTEYLKLIESGAYYGITADLVDAVSSRTGKTHGRVEQYLSANFAQRSIDEFYSNYIDMAFSGREQATDFEVATTTVFNEAFKLKATHLGQTGSVSAPDVLLVSDTEGWQGIVDTKAYPCYSITGDHHNRMCHNYVEKVGNYSDCPYPVGFYTYIAGGLCGTIDKQLEAEYEDCRVRGSAVTVRTFVEMAKRAESHPYPHSRLHDIFGIGRQILLADL